MNLIIEQKQHGKYAIRDEHTGGFTYNRPCEDFDTLVTQLADLLEEKDFVTHAILDDRDNEIRELNNKIEELESFIKQFKTAAQ